MQRGTLFALVTLFSVMIKMGTSETFIPPRLLESVLQLCNNFKNRIRCPPVSCEHVQKKCSQNSDCDACSPTSMEICCQTSKEGSGCCVNMPLPLAVGGKRR